MPPSRPGTRRRRQPIPQPGHAGAVGYVNDMKTLLKIVLTLALAVSLLVLSASANEAAKPAAPKKFRPGKKGQKRVLIVTGVDHPGHKWRLTTPVLAAGIDKDPRLAVYVVETPEFLASAKLQIGRASCRERV